MGVEVHKLIFSQIKCGRLFSVYLKVGVQYTKIVNNNKEGLRQKNVFPLYSTTCSIPCKREEIFSIRPSYQPHSGRQQRYPRRRF